MFITSHFDYCSSFLRTFPHLALETLSLPSSLWPDCPGNRNWYCATPTQNLLTPFCITQDKSSCHFLSTLFILFFLWCCAGWGYIVAFTQVVTMYQIYHTWIHLLNHSPSFPPLPHLDSWSNFNRYRFCIDLHVYTFSCTIFILLLLFTNTSPAHCCQPSPLLGPLLFSLAPNSLSSQIGFFAISQSHNTLSSLAFARAVASSSLSTFPLKAGWL
jgi:hypothetical protein